MSISNAEEDVVLDDSHFSDIYSQLKKCSVKWKEIGIYLGFSPGELDTIGANQNAEGVQGYLHIMLSKWFEWAPGDHRGSKQVATLGVLKEAVRRAEYGRTANSLSVTKEQTNGNTRVHASTERNGSADEPPAKRPRQE